MFSISVIDYLGIIEDGIGILLSLNVDEDIYELIYWFDKNNNQKVVIDKKFLEKYKISNFYEFSEYKNIINYINLEVIPPKDKIWKEIGENT